MSPIVQTVKLMVRLHVQKIVIVHCLVPMNVITFIIAIPLLTLICSAKNEA